MANIIVPYEFTLADGVELGREHTVQAFPRGRFGCQTAQRGAVATVTPEAGVPLESLVVPTEGGPLLRIGIGGVPINVMPVHMGLPSSMYDASCDDVWVMSKPVYTSRIFNEDAKGTSNAYLNSAISIWLENELFPTIEQRVREQIKQVKIPYWNNGTVFSGTDGLSCHIFLASGYEVGFTQAVNTSFPIDGAKLSYFAEGESSDACTKRIAHLANVATIWLLRSSFTSYSSAVWAVGEDGKSRAPFFWDANGIRFLMVLPRGMLFHATPNADGTYSPVGSIFADA